MTFTFNPSRGSHYLVEKACSAHAGRRLLQIVVERSGFPGYLGTDDHVLYPKTGSDNEHTVEGGTLYQIWQDTGDRTDFMKGAYDPDRFHAESVEPFDPQQFFKDFYKRWGNGPQAKQNSLLEQSKQPEQNPQSEQGSQSEQSL
ncbi:uncharacterized protein IL334_007618 [Kwoniella shivajii]|uniref:Uncharacterized protein n=1 Tax=Kwoniella shivajii TaxID=564305 RepID=A0ABZ1D9Q5_9TREE|nr:hypothetical protein IL334_007618 [Kwoniella shivajii]